MSENNSHGKDSGLRPHAVLPGPMTEACSRFFKSHGHLWGFVLFVTGMTAHTDKAAQKVVEVLLESESVEYREESKKILERGPQATEALRSYSQLLYQMMLSYGLNNFLTYVAELLALVFETRPETLRSSEVVKLEFILGHSSMDDLIRALAERRVEHLLTRACATFPITCRKSSDSISLILMKSSKMQYA